MTKKLSWRLSKLPTPDEVRELVKDKIITQEEAREILFSLETEEVRDKKSLESEIKFLRELVEKLSKNRTAIIETIQEVRVPYYQHHWYRPYEAWCGATYSTGTTTSTSTDTENVLLVTTPSTLTTTSNFSDIKTF